MIGEYASRLCMLEGFVGHAEQCQCPRAPIWRAKTSPTGSAAPYQGCSGIGAKHGIGTHNSQ